MNNKFISRAATIVFALAMAVFGIYHFIYPHNVAIQVPDYIAGIKIWVYVIGAALILAGLAFIINRKVKLAGYLLALLLIIFVLVIHLPGYLNAGQSEDQTTSFINMIKDTGLACCAVLIASKD